MQKILSLFSLTPENVGDMACGWGNQYETFTVVKSNNSKIVSNNIVTFSHINDVRNDYHKFDLVVIGGGCIINPSHEKGIWRAIESSKNCTIRSVGVQDWNFAQKLNDKLKHNFTIRHTVKGFNYEACPSLVDVEKFKVLNGKNKKIEKSIEILFACHQNHKYEIEILKSKGYNVIVNNCSFNDAIETISKTKKIVTSSYHFLLWANEFNCELEVFSHEKLNTNEEKLPIDSGMRKFLNIPIKYDLVDIDKYIK